MRDHFVAQTLLGEDRRKHGARWLAVLVRSIFHIMSVPAFSPGLRIERNKFVAPASISQAQEIHPGEIEALERKVQLVPATLTVTGARVFGCLLRSLSFTAARVVT
jgi:hypothetical protein